MRNLTYIVFWKFSPVWHWNFNFLSNWSAHCWPYPSTGGSLRPKSLGWSRLRLLSFLVLFYFFSTSFQLSKSYCLSQAGHRRRVIREEVTIFLWWYVCIRQWVSALWNPNVSLSLKVNFVGVFCCYWLTHGFPFVGDIFSKGIFTFPYHFSILAHQYRLCLWNSTLFLRSVPIGKFLLQNLRLHHSLWGWYMTDRTSQVVHW